MNATGMARSRARTPAAKVVSPTRAHQRAGGRPLAAHQPATHAPGPVVERDAAVRAGFLSIPCRYCPSLCEADVLVLTRHLAHACRGVPAAVRAMALAALQPRAAARGDSPGSEVAPAGADASQSVPDPVLSALGDEDFAPLAISEETETLVAVLAAERADEVRAAEESAIVAAEDPAAPSFSLRRFAAELWATDRIELPLRSRLECAAHEAQAFDLYAAGLGA